MDFLRPLNDEIIFDTEETMKTHLMRISILTLIFFFLFPSPVAADGIIIPEPPICPTLTCLPSQLPMEQLVIRYHHVTVSIHDQVATTHVNQVFYNPNNWPIEGIYTFPIPAEAVVTNFTLWIDGKAVQGQVLDADQARQKYQEIVSSLRDPALLEYVGRGAVQARIYPIAPGAERRIELEYSQVLTADNGLVKYTYPLNTEKFSARPLESVSIHVDILSTQEPIRAVYSPTHKVDTEIKDNQHATATFEASNVTPDSDFSLYYSIGKSAAFHLITYRDPTDPLDPDGFFLLLLAPSPEINPEIQAKDVILVLDHSGSMDGEKFQQAQVAAGYILKHLNPKDRFNVISFSTSVDTFAESLAPANDAASAVDWINSQTALGSTDINRALLEAAAMSDGEHPTYVIFMTDGLPTEGVTDRQQILDNLAKTAPDNLRLFTFGVGYDVDTVLLDSLAQEHHGTSTYVQPGDRLDEVLSSFYARISTPVLTDLSLDFGSLSTHDIYPSPLPDLFSGSQVVVTGRYHQPGRTTITLKGQINGQTQSFTYPDQVFPADARDTINVALPRLWATRKIGFLLNKVRLQGPDQETIAQIVKLSIRYGIVTPYTSYLVTEDMPLGQAEQERIAADQYKNQVAMPTAPASGAPAVQQAAGQGQMAGADSVVTEQAGLTDLVRIVGSRTFVLKNETWLDTTYDPAAMQTIKVPFLSQDYFALSNARPDLAAAFALGEHVIAVLDGKAYEVVASSETTNPVAIPATITPGMVSTPQSGNPPVVSPIPGATVKSPCFSSLLGLLPIGLLVLRKRKRSL